MIKKLVGKLRKQLLFICGITALLQVTAVSASGETELQNAKALPELEGYQVRFDYEN
jgi:hypothetical protein